MEQEGDVHPCAHLEVLGDPFQAHRRLASQPAGQFWICWSRANSGAGQR